MTDCTLIESNGRWTCTVCGWSYRKKVRRNCRGVRTTSTATPPDAFSDVPCRHRGHETRTVLCELCGPEKGLQVSVRQCDVHGECVRRKFKAGSAAIGGGLTCSDREPSPAKCSHRGEMKRTVDLGHGRQCAFYECRLHGECTAGDFGLEGVNACVMCEERPE